MLEAIRELTDGPPELHMWLDDMEQWRLELEAWAITQPVDYSYDCAKWRMFGGPWLHHNEMMIFTKSNGDLYSLMVIDAIRSLPEQHQKEFAEMFYQRKEAAERAKRTLGEWYLAREKSDTD